MNDLHALFKKYGGLSLKFRQKCIGMLPEIYKQKIYDKHKMSIFEYAAKFAGISHEQVRVVLRLDKKFEDKPVLKKLLNDGEVSVNKLVRVAAVATPENEEFWANQVQLLPKSAVETLVKDMKMSTEAGTKELLENKKDENQYGLQEALFEEKSLPGQTFEGSAAKCQAGLKLDEDIIQELQKLQQKGININQIIREALEQREQQIIQEKQKISEKIAAQGPAKSRYISVKIKRVIQKEQGTKCSIPTCSKPSENLHHTQRFGLSQNHNPHFLAQLCKDHHMIAHSIDQKFQARRLMAINSG